jgi:hypothetical protein
MDEYVRHRVNSLAENFPVATKKPNAFGLFDMGGNVAEWIAEYYEFYPEPGEDPVWIDLSTRELRLARGGAYIKSTNSVELVENINLIINKGSWDYTKAEKIKYTPFYSFKCYSTIPILYLFPQHFIDRQMKAYGCKDFYEYYFEPSGKSGMVFFQFLNEDFNRGLACKTHLETLLFSTHLFLFLLAIYVIKLFSEKSKYKNYVVIFLITFVMLRFINPLTTQYSLFKAQRQQYFG